MRYLILVIVAFFTSPAFTQDRILLPPCPEQNLDTLEGAVTRMNCLEANLEELRKSQNLILNSLLNVQGQLDKAVADFGLEINGPERIVELIPAVKYIKSDYYGHPAGALRGLQKSYECGPKLPAKAGFVIFGANATSEFEDFKPGCSPQGSNCANLMTRVGGVGDSCKHQGRTVGCYVNIDWLEWFKRRAEKNKVAVDYSSVCVQ